jgi:hypothetical protein
MKEKVSIWISCDGEKVVDDLKMSRDGAAFVIRQARRNKEAFSVLRVLHTSHVYIKSHRVGGLSMHLIWPESEVRVQARLAREREALGFRLSVL